MKLLKFLYADTSKIVCKMWFLLAGGGGRRKGGKEEEEEESLKSIALSNSRTWGARLTECASDPSEGGLMPSHLSQNFSTVHLSIWEQNGFAISWRLMN